MKDRAYRPKFCRYCKQLFTPALPGQRVCSIECAQAVGEKQSLKKRRAETKERLDALKTIPKLIAELQVWFNRFIRLRDKYELCICCDEPLETVEDFLTGGGYDAGHYRNRQTAPQLRFNEDNVHAQRKYCNRDRGGNVLGYRQRLIKRIGLARVEALENDNTVRKWTREELRGLLVHYKALCKELANG